MPKAAIEVLVCLKVCKGEFGSESILIFLAVMQHHGRHEFPNQSKIYEAAVPAIDCIFTDFLQL